MATSPSREFDENGVLVTRAISTDVAGDPDEAEATADRPYKESDATTFADRAKARTSGGTKAVSATKSENKSVKSAAKK